MVQQPKQNDQFQDMMFQALLAPLLACLQASSGQRGQDSGELVFISLALSLAAPLKYPRFASSVYNIMIYILLFFLLWIFT